MENSATNSVIRCWSTIGVWGEQTPRCDKLKKVIHCRNCRVYWDAGRKVFEKSMPEGYLEQWTQTLANPPVVPEKPSKSVIYFRLGNDWYSLPTQYFVEISPIKTLRQIPHQSGKKILGLVNVGGAVRLCFSLAHLLGVDAPDNKFRSYRYGIYKRYAVIKIRDHDFVFPVDEVGGVHRFTVGDIKTKDENLPGNNSDLISGRLIIEGISVSCIDADKLVHGFEVLADE